jgi:predicted nucleic acid-binding protein
VRVLFDTNVVLDVLLAREPHVEDASRLFSLVDRGAIDGLLGATTITTIHYIASKALGPADVAHHLGELLTMFEVGAVDLAVLRGALALSFADFEDAVLHEAARSAGAQAIVTLNVRDFIAGELPVFEPRDLLAALDAAAGPH